MGRYLTGNETRTRLLEAAAEVFAESGFSYAKVQDICRRAHANLAAVNYHFGGKEQLYRAVIHYAITEDTNLLPYLMVPPKGPPQERLREFIRVLLFSMLMCGRSAWHGKIMMNELLNPSSALDLVVDQLVRPVHEFLRAIIAEHVRSEADSEDVHFFTTCILSQCIIYHHSKETLVRLNPGQEFDPAALEQLADRITRFSLAAIDHYSITEMGKEQTLL